MKILRLLVKQIKGVRSIEILAHPTLNEIAGPNGAGKSSVLDSIVWALGGKRNIDAKPLRDGQEKGEIVLETERFICTRRFSENGDSKLTIQSKDGAKWGQNQLDDIFSEFTFDPLAFSRMTPTEQLNVMRSLVGKEYNEKLATLETLIDNNVDARKYTKRDLDKIGQIPEVEKVDEEAVKKLDDEINQLIRKQGEMHRRAREYKEYQDKLKNKSELAKEHNALDEKIKTLRESRDELRKSAKLPVDGVEFSDSGLRVGGIPFEQLSSSEKIRISARIGMSMRPELRIMFCHDGSLLDENSFAEIKKLAENSDYQLWLESVGKGHGEAIILEAGEIVNAPITQVESF